MPDIFKIETRIKGGFSTKGPLPFQLRLDYAGWLNGFCGATLISSKYAISAAHCLINCNVYVDLSLVEIVAGAYNRLEG